MSHLPSLEGEYLKLEYYANVTSVENLPAQKFPKSEFRLYYYNQLYFEYDYENDSFLVTQASSVWESFTNRTLSGYQVEQSYRHSRGFISGISIWYYQVFFLDYTGTIQFGFFRFYITGPSMTLLLP